MSIVPVALRTARLLLRPWAPGDAPALHPLLVANAAHIGPWIPAHVAAVAPLPALAERLAGFAADFAEGRAFRFALLDAGGALLGEADLFARDADGRVPLAQGDRAEIGYWLDARVTGRGYATEAAAALLDVAATLPGIAHAEIRCDPRNRPSAAVPRRLGFALAGEDAEEQRWTRPLRGA